MKKQVIIFSKVFPKKHPKYGSETHFEKKLKAGEKRHTIRSNYEYWNKKVHDVNSGKSYLSCRVWSSSPYRSPQIEFMVFEQIGIQKLYYDGSCFFIEGKKVSKVLLSKYDGLSLDDFNDWFKDYPPGEMAIIHFSTFRY